MAEQTIDKSSSGGEITKKNDKKDLAADPEFFSCILQPCIPDSDPNYIGIRRLLLFRKAESGVIRRKDWRCNGKGYVAFRNYINRPRNWESMPTQSHPSSPGNSGRWIGSPGLLSQSFEVESWSTGRDLRSTSRGMSRTTSFSSNASDIDHSRKKTEPAYSFVGMHCIFDQCRGMVTVLKFGHMSSDLLAYGASDGTLTVCTVSQPPSVIKQLIGHSKDVTDFDFSLNNQYIASSSLDKTVRVWDISQGLCVRVIYGVSSQLCIRFHPVNNNFLSAGNANKEITVINTSLLKALSLGSKVQYTMDNYIWSVTCVKSGNCISTFFLNFPFFSLTQSEHVACVSFLEPYVGGILGMIKKENKTNITILSIKSNPFTSSVLCEN